MQLLIGQKLHQMIRRALRVILGHHEHALMLADHVHIRDVIGNNGQPVGFALHHGHGRTLVLGRPQHGAGSLIVGLYVRLLAFKGDIVFHVIRLDIGRDSLQGICVISHAEHLKSCVRDFLMNEAHNPQRLHGLLDLSNAANPDDIVFR